MTTLLFASILTLTNLCGSVRVDTFGGRVVSYVPAGGEEVLAALKDGSGGIALCWPWFANDGPAGCRRHGVARYHGFAEVSRSESPRRSELTLRLVSDAGTRREFPHDFTLTLVVRLDDRLTLRLIGENTGREPFAVTEMLHPYFRTGDARRCAVRGLDGLTFRDNVHPELGDRRVWSGEYAVAEGSKVFAFASAGEHRWDLADPVLSRVLSFTSSGDLKTVVWSPGETSGKGKNVTSKLAPGEWRTFVCVENGTCYGDRAYVLRPGERHELVRTVAVSHADRQTRGWSFEDETDELPSRVEILPSKWLPADTKDARFASRRDTRRARSGRASWYLRSDDTNGINHAFFQDLPVEAGRRYAFRASYWLEHRGGPVCAWGNYRFLTAEGKPVDGRFRQIRQGDCTPGRWNEAYVSFYVPSNAATASVHLTFGGRQEVWIDDASFGEAPERLPAADAVRIPGTGGLAVYSPLSKAPLRGLPADLPTGDGVVRLDAARNEKEHFQLVVVPASAGRIDVSPRPFVRADGKPCAGGAAVPSWRIRRVEFVPAKGGFNPAMNRMHPDAVTAFAGAEVSPATNLVLLATVRVPESAEPGAYASALVLSDGRRVPVSLRVRTFALPRAASLKTFFHALPTWGGYSLFDRRGKEACIADIHGIFGDMRISGNQNVIAQAPLPKWKLEGGRVVVTDWSAVDRHVRDLNARYGFTYFTVPGLRTLGDNGGWYACRARPTVKAPFSNRTVGEGPFETPFGGFFDEPAALDRVIGYLRQFAEHAKSALPDFEFRWYIYDEPCFFTLAELGRIMSRIESARTGVRLMIVASHFSDRLPTPYMAVGGYAPRNIHPIARDCTERFFYQYRATLDDGQYVANRLFPWQVYAAEGDGALLWDVIAYGRTSPWENLTAGYQDAYPVMLYPPRPGLDEGTVPSMRSVLIADGIEDFDYLKLLEAGYEALRPGSGRAAVMKALGDLLPPEDSPLPSPAQVRLVRARLADLIESFRRF